MSDEGSTHLLKVSRFSSKVGCHFSIVPLNNNRTASVKISNRMFEIVLELVINEVSRERVNASGGFNHKRDNNTRGTDKGTILVELTTVDPFGSAFRHCNAVVLRTIRTRSRITNRNVDPRAMTCIVARFTKDSDISSLSVLITVGNFLMDVIEARPALLAQPFEKMIANHVVTPIHELAVEVLTIQGMSAIMRQNDALIAGASG